MAADVGVVVVGMARHWGFGPVGSVPLVRWGHYRSPGYPPLLTTYPGVLCRAAGDRVWRADVSVPLLNLDRL